MSSQPIVYTGTISNLVVNCGATTPIDVVLFESAGATNYPQVNVGTYPWSAQAHANVVGNGSGLVTLQWVAYQVAGQPGTGSNVVGYTPTPVTGFNGDHSDLHPQAAGVGAPLGGPYLALRVVGSNGVNQGVNCATVSIYWTAMVWP